MQKIQTRRGFEPTNSTKTTSVICIALGKCHNMRLVHLDWYSRNMWFGSDRYYSDSSWNISTHFFLSVLKAVAMIPSTDKYLENQVKFQTEFWQTEKREFSTSSTIVWSQRQLQLVNFWRCQAYCINQIISRLHPNSVLLAPNGVPKHAPSCLIYTAGD